MSGRGTIEHLYKIATKKPSLQAALDNILFLTDTEIDGMIEHQVWIRTKLKAIKKAKETEDRMVGLNIPGAAMETYPAYDVFIYTGGDCIINASGYGAMAFDVSQNDIFIICDDEYAKINSMVVKCVGKDREMLKNNSIFVDRKTIIEYNEYLQEILNGKHFGKLDDERNGPDGWMGAIRYS